MIRILSLLLLCVFAAACSPGGDKPKEAASAQASGSYERGPNNGRLLRDGDFALEVTIYETNAPHITGSTPIVTASQSPPLMLPQRSSSPVWMARSTNSRSGQKATIWSAAVK